MTAYWNNCRHTRNIQRDWWVRQRCVVKLLKYFNKKSPLRGSKNLKLQGIQIISGWPCHNLTPCPWTNRRLVFQLHVFYNNKIENCFNWCTQKGVFLVPADITFSDMQQSEQILFLYDVWKQTQSRYLVENMLMLYWGVKLIWITQAWFYSYQAKRPLFK